MQIHSQEHHDIMAAFEEYVGGKPTRELKEFWTLNAYYTDDNTNQQFKAFRAGYKFAATK